MIDAFSNLLFPLTLYSLQRFQVQERQWGPVCPVCWDRCRRLRPPFLSGNAHAAPFIEVSAAPAGYRNTRLIRTSALISMIRFEK